MRDKTTQRCAGIFQRRRLHLQIKDSAGAFARTAALCALLAACGGGGGGGSKDPLGAQRNSLTPFAFQKTDDLPAGTRIDVSSKNLFQMAAGDFWNFKVLDAGGNPNGI